MAALAQATPQTRLLAGGTDLVRALRRPGSEPDLLVDLTGITELTSVRLEDGSLRVGALATFTQLQWDPLVRGHALCLSLAAAQVGSAQIRNAGTIGGNIANASPCADGATALTALGADVTTVDGAGTTNARPIGKVLLGPNRTGLRHDEAITEFSFPAVGAVHRSAFAKIGSRGGERRPAECCARRALRRAVGSHNGRARGAGRGRRSGVPRPRPRAGPRGTPCGRGVGAHLRRGLRGGCARSPFPAATPCPTSSTPPWGLPTTLEHAGAQRALRARLELGGDQSAGAGAGSG